MALRNLFVAALVVCAACKGKGESKDLEARCQGLAKACADNDKHAAKLADECKQAAQSQPKCVDKATAAYDCYQKELCGKADKVWALDDLRVLADRNSKCVAEQKAFAECGSK